MELDLINVGIGDIQTGKAPQILRTILGSCVGICLYHEKRKIGGLAHIMLPEMKGEGRSPNKYADQAIPNLISAMKDAGADKKNLTAKIVGGATMFKLSDDSVMGEIGKNNIKKVREILEFLDIPIIAEEVNGDMGRSIDFFVDSGEIKIKSVGREVKRI
jgi:chemotaxis protein CheD